MSGPGGSTRPAVLSLAAGAVVLYVAGQAYLLYDISGLERWRPLEGLLRSGDLALTVLFAIAGYTATDRLLARREGGLRALFGWFQWYVAGTVALVGVVAGAVLLVHALDPTDIWTDEQTRTSVRQVLTFQWNQYVMADPLGVRGDLTPLWYFSAEMQLVLVALGAVLVLGRRPKLLALVAVVAAGGSWWLRAELLDSDGWFVASLTTAARADAFLLGAAAAALGRGDWLSPHRAAGMAGGAFLVLAGGVLATSYTDVEEFLLIQGPLLAVATAALLAGAGVGTDERTLVSVALSAPLLAACGSAWRPILAWTAPALSFVDRHLTDFPGNVRGVSAALLLVLLALVTQVAGTAVAGRIKRVWRRRAEPEGARPVG